MNDMRSTIIPKSDQLNSDDLLTGSLTIKITGVDIKGGQEQPVSIHFEGDNGKPYKACKSMCRVMVSAWGADSKKYVGRSMTIYRDPAVKWGGMEVGGIRISHMSDIESALTMALTVTRANRKPFTVRPITKQKEPAAPSNGVAHRETTGETGRTTSQDVAATVDEALLIKAREWADCGTKKYAAWFEALPDAKQKAIGRKRHDELWAIAEKVPA